MVSNPLKTCFLYVILVLFLASSVFASELNLTYDANGNLVTGDGKYRVYNSLNQLWKVYNGSTNATLLQEYVYDPIEERVALKRTYNSSGSTVESIYYFSEEFVRVVNASGTFDFTYVFHEGQLVAQNNGSVTYFIHNDIEGTSSVVTNSSGSVIERIVYSPYGERLNASSVRFGYEAEEYDTVLGDTDFDFRCYKQDWGIFEQPDSILPDVYGPQTLNRYAFNLNNPVKYTDPTGHCPWCFQWVVNNLGSYATEAYLVAEAFVYRIGIPAFINSIPRRIGIGISDYQMTHGDGGGSVQQGSGGQCALNYCPVVSQPKGPGMPVNGQYTPQQPMPVAPPSGSPTMSTDSYGGNYRSPYWNGGYVSGSFNHGVGYVTSNGAIYPTNNANFRPRYESGSGGGSTNPPQGRHSGSGGGRLGLCRARGNARCG